jgi:hypothetical protein
MNKAQGRRSSKNKAYYKQQFARTEVNKARNREKAALLKLASR